MQCQIPTSDETASRNHNRYSTGNGSHACKRRTPISATVLKTVGVDADNRWEGLPLVVDVTEKVQGAGVF